MRFDQNKLIFLSLLVLDEVCWKCGQGPVAPSSAVRLALASLYALGNGERRLFDDFWKEMRNPHSNAYSEIAGNTLRASYTRTYFTGIARSVGVDLNIEQCDRLAKAQHKIRALL